MSSYHTNDVSATAGPSYRRSITGFWRKNTEGTSSPSVNVDIPPTPFTLPTPPPAIYNACHGPCDAPIFLEDFFAAGAIEAHRPFTHAATVSAPPPYAPYGHEIVKADSGVYAVREPPTLARMLFIYGFLFFPFWLAGIYILASPLLPTPDWESGKSEFEKAQLLLILRETEKKWARRCLYAMCTLTVTVLILAVIIKFAILPSV